MKKGTYKVVAEALATGQFGKIPVSTSRIDHRRLSIDEIKQIVKEEFGKAQEAAKTKLQEPEGGWSDAELEMEIDWSKALDIREFFEKK